MYTYAITISTVQFMYDLFFCGKNNNFESKQTRKKYLKIKNQELSHKLIV